MKLAAFCYGVTQITGDMAVPGGDPERRIPISLLFFLVETDSRRILVDVGCDTMPGFPLAWHRSPVEVLEEAGIPRQSITDVILTHAHHDHADALRYYPGALLHIQEEALSKARRYIPREMAVKTFGHCTEAAPGVEVRHIGGHAQGSAIVVLDTEPVTVLCGDECYTQENLEKGIPTGSSRCPEKSRAFVEEYGKDGYKTILFHDCAVAQTPGSVVLLE